MDDLYARHEWFVEGLDVRAASDGGPTMLGGYAAVFGQEAIISGPDGVRWRERIAPTAFDESLTKDDVLAAVNHDINQVLGRTKSGTVTLKVDAHGLRYDVKLPNTSLARDTIENIRTGVLAGSSFRFGRPKPGDIRLVKENGRSSADLPLLLLERLTLRDVGPVVTPAYDGTSVSVRSMSESVVELLRQAREDDAVGYRNTMRARIAIEQAKAWGA